MENVGHNGSWGAPPLDFRNLEEQDEQLARRVHANPNLHHFEQGESRSQAGPGGGIRTMAAGGG